MDAEPWAMLIAHFLARDVLMTVSAIILKARVHNAHVRLIFNTLFLSYNFIGILGHYHLTINVGVLLANGSGDFSKSVRTRGFDNMIYRNLF